MKKVMYFTIEVEVEPDFPTDMEIAAKRIGQHLMSAADEGDIKLWLYGQPKVFINSMWVEHERNITIIEEGG